MVRVFWITIIVSFLMVVGLKAEPGSAQGVVSIKGRVINGTSGAEAPGTLPVLLLATDQDGRVAATAQGLTDDTGGFEFGELPLLDAGQYVFSVDYAGVLYGEVLSPEEISGGVEIQVFETTWDVTVVQVRRQVLVIAGVDRTEREISAIEFVLLANETDRTLLPDVSNPAMMSFLRFSLPPGSHDLDVQSNLPSREVISVGSGFAITSPVIPGRHSVEYSYLFPYQGSALSYRQPLLQGAEVYQVLVPEHLAPLRAGMLDEVEPVRIQGTVYQAWESRNIDAGQGVALELLELPEPSLPDRFQRAITSTTLWRVVLPSALGAFLAVLLLLGAFRGRAGFRTATEALGAPAADVPLDLDRMVQEIADLDDRYERGELIDEEYQERRQGLKSRILESRQNAPGRSPD